jgi:hypothetical protein
MKFTEEYIKKLKEQGLIRDYRITPRSKSAVKLPSGDCKEVQWMHWQLVLFQDEHDMKLVKEYRFHEKRKWRFDFAFPEQNIAIEYEGLMSEKSGHTTLKGFTGDTEKYNEAARLGWKVLRYTVLTYKNVIQDLKKLIQS